jgi:hypothetical protein
MAQRIQSYNPFAEEALRLSEKVQGQDGMARTSAPIGPNLQDGGGMSKPSVNAQPFNNLRLTQQNENENAKTRLPGAQASALGQARKGIVEQSGAEYEAQKMMADRVATMLYANDGGTATFALGIPETQAIRTQHAAEQKAIAYGSAELPFASNNLPA